MLRSERARPFDMLESLAPLIVLEPLLASESVVVLEPLTAFELPVALAALAPLAAFESLAALEPLVVSAALSAGVLLVLPADELLSCTSPPDGCLTVPGAMLPVRGAQVVALLRALTLSAGRLPATIAVRLPVVVVSAPTPAAPLVALRPLKRVSGLVEVLFGTVLAGTPAVLPASVGVPVVAVVGAVTAVPLVAVVAPEVVAALAPACADEVLPLTDDGGHGVVERGVVLPPVSCCAMAPPAMVVLNSIAMPAIRHRTIRSVNSVELNMNAS